MAKYPVNKSTRLGGVWARVATDRYSAHSIPASTEDDSPSLGSTVTAQLTKNELRLNLIAEIMRNFLQLDKFRKSAQQIHTSVDEDESMKENVEVTSMVDYQMDSLQKALLLFELVPSFCDSLNDSLRNELFLNTSIEL